MDFPDPGIKPGSPALQANSSPTELLGESLKKKLYLKTVQRHCFGGFFVFVCFFHHAKTSLQVITALFFIKESKVNFHKTVSSVGESLAGYNQLRESYQGKLPISCQFRMTPGS